jgi:hypothetical protein
MLMAGVAGIAVLLIVVLSIARSGLLSSVGQGVYAKAWVDVLETRIATVGSRESGQGGYILYRIEAHVRYSMDGATRDWWIPASDATSDRTGLQLQLVDAPRTCLVYWTPGHEDNARCELQKASK